MTHFAHPFVRLPRLRQLRRLGALATAVGVATVVTALPASAHVHVTSDDAAPGGYGVLTFRVPTESNTASTVKVVVTLPKATPFPSVSVKPHAGWTSSAPKQPLGATVKVGDFTLTDAVLAVTWTAQTGGGIGPGGFDEFELSVGPFPDDAKEIAFVVDQTYSDGTVEHWNQSQAPGAEEPENPAPVLQLTGDSAGAGSGSTGTDTTTRAIAVSGLVVALVATALAALALTQSRRRRVTMEA